MRKRMENVSHNTTDFFGKHISWKEFLVLQGAVILYTLAGVAGKYASGQSFLSWNFILLYGVEIIILGVYALIWQQIIKRYDLSIAYANRSMALLWSMLWAYSLFHEHITWKNVLGAIIVIAGTIIINGESHE